MAFTTFRDTIKRICPPWLAGGWAERFMYACAIQLDLLGDACAAGVKLRFPGLYSYESLPMIGRERRIPRGRTESDATYAARLIPWWDDHKRHGGPYALLSQLHAYWAPNNFPITLVYYSGAQYVLDPATGVVTRSVIEGGYHPDDDAVRWARWYLFYEWPAPLHDDGTWDDPGTWDDGGVWDSDLSGDDVEAIRLVPTDWNNAHSLGTVVLTNGGEFWDFPAGTWDEPGGVWGEDSTQIVQIPIE